MVEMFYVQRFALAEGMPELLVFVVINAVSITCIVFWYFIKNMISVITSIDVACKGHIGEDD